jgi:hypothetical protein
MLAAETRERGLELALHGPRGRLALPPGEAGAVVVKHQLHRV